MFLVLIMHMKTIDVPFLIIDDHTVGVGIYNVKEMFYYNGISIEQKIKIPSDCNLTYAKADGTSSSVVASDYLSYNFGITPFKNIVPIIGTYHSMNSLLTTILYFIFYYFFFHRLKILNSKCLR